MHFFILLLIFILTNFFYHGFIKLLALNGIQLWDASTGQGLLQYKEHQKRAWSVDFSCVDPKTLASGSDDCSVRLWSINEVCKKTGAAWILLSFGIRIFSLFLIPFFRSK